MPKDKRPALPHKVSMQMEVQDVIKFMQDNVCPYRLVSVARALAGMAPVLWGIIIKRKFWHFGLG
jgi:hypothetical protein